MTTYPQTGDPQSAGTLADGSTISHQTEHGRSIGIWENVKHYGAIPDGTTDCTTAIQAAITALSTSGGTLFFPQGTYKITSALTLPSTASSPASHTRWHIVGYGATIKATTAITMLKSVTPADNSAAVSQSNCQYTIEGLSFLGNNTSGQKALQLIATYGSVVRDCVFNSLDVGIDGIFAINTRIEECFFVGLTTTDILLRSATYGSGAPIWSGASNDFTASNNCYVINCRHSQSTGQTRTVEIAGTGQCVIDGCIYEGGTPLTSVYYTGNGSTNARTFTMRNCWFESGGASTYKCIELPNFIGVELDHIRFLAGGGTNHIDVSGATGGGHIKLYDCEFVATDPKIKQANQSNPQWMAIDNNPADLFTNATYWSSVQPFYWSHITQSSNASVVQGNQIILKSSGDHVYVEDGTGAFQALQAGTVVIHGNLRISTSATATTPGSIVRKLLIQDASGSDLGYIPIYNAIT